MTAKQNWRRGLSCASAVAALAGGWTGSAHAQAAGSARAGAGDDGLVQEVVVTARRREENLQDVPESIQAFSGSMLRQYTVQNVADLAQIAPGLNAQPSVFGKGPLTLAIRGQRQSLANIAYDQPVSVYVDEVVQARTQGLNDAFYDLDSVQVLKGPQGTLFGRNTTGGALLITTKAPTKTFEGYVDGTAGNYSLGRLEGAINLPLNEMLQVRLAGVFTTRDGYIKDPAQGNRIDDAHTNSWRASIRFSPADSFRNDLVVNGFNENDSGVAYKLIAVRPGSLAAPALPDLTLYGNSDFWTSNATAPRHGSRIHTVAVSDIWTLDLGAVRLKNIVGYRRVHSDIYFDLDGSSAFIADSRQIIHERQYSDEFQVLGTALDKALDYVAGAYWFKETGDENQTTRLLSPTSPNNLVTQYSVISETEAVYAQATYRLPMAPKISVTAGGRYTWDKRVFDAYHHFSSGVCRLLTADANGVPLSPCFREASANFSKPTYDVSVDWKPNRDMLLYFTHRFGYQAGGFTNSAQRPSEFIPFRPQSVRDYELGFKANWNLGDVAAQTNIALFRGDYKDIQRLQTINVLNPAGVPSPINRILNAATSRVQGVELEVRVRPVQPLELSVAYTYLDAKYRKYIVNGQDFTGAPFAGAPKNSVSASARLRLPTPETVGELFAQVDGSYQSSSVVVDTSSFDPVTQTVFPNSFLPGYGTVNARVDLNNVAGRPLKLSAFVRNFTNEKYYTSGNDGYSGLGTVIRLLGAPRTFGVEANYSF